MTTTKRPDVRFIVRVERDPGLLSGDRVLYALTLEACYLGTDRYDRDPDAIKVLNPVWGSYLHGAGEPDELDSFTMHAQAEREGESGWYGMGASYRQPYDVGEDRAAAMVKVLRKVKRAVTKHTDAYGYMVRPETYFAVVAKAAGATSGQPFGVRDESYPGGYRWMDATALGSLLADVAAGKRDDLAKTRAWA